MSILKPKITGKHSESFPENGKETTIY